MRRLITALATSAILLHAGSILARTPAASCRVACAPRIAEQCDGLSGGALRRCRRPLLRACRQSTPLVACESTADLSTVLAEHVLHPGTGSTEIPVALCATGRFTTSVTPPASDPNERVGDWAVRVASGGLVLALNDDGGASRQVPIGRNDAGDVVLDGVAAALADGSAACFVPAPPPPADTDALVAIARALSDRSLHTAVLGLGNASTSRQRSLTLCADGTFTSSTTSGSGTNAVTTEDGGAWTIVAVDGGAAIALDSASRGPQQLDIAVVPRVRLDHQIATVADARAACTPPADLPSPPDALAQLTEGLRDTAYSFVTHVGAIPVRTKLGLCGTGRYAISTTSTQRGPWDVELVDTAPALVLHDDAGAIVRVFKVSFDTDGAVLLDGQIHPTDDPSLVDTACQ